MKKAQASLQATQEAPPASSPAPDAQQVHAPGEAPRQAPASPETSPDAAPSDLDAHVVLSQAAEPPDLMPGALAQPYSLPPELAANLTILEQRLCLALFSGLSWQKALTACDVPPRAALRDAGPPPQVVEGTRALLAEVAYRCASDRKWILTNIAALYRRAAAVEPVLDRSGRETGVYRFDGATARSCLELMGQELGMFGKRVVHDVSDPLRRLLDQVAQRGKPALEARQPRTIDHASAGRSST